MGIFTKKIKTAEETKTQTINRRIILLDKLNQFKKIGVLQGPQIDAHDLDYLYDMGWELIASSDGNYVTQRFYFKKI